MRINEKAMLQSTLIPAKDRLREQSTTLVTNQSKTPLARNLIDLLFLRLEAIYGYSWTSRHTDLDAWEITKDEWGIGLANINHSEIRKTLDELRTNGDQFPPTLPMFIKMCLAESGIPSEEKAYQMAISRDFTHPLAKLCYEKIGSWDFTHDSAKDLRKKFSIAYKEVLKEFPKNQKMIA